LTPRAGAGGGAGPAPPPPPPPAGPRGGGAGWGIIVSAWPSALGELKRGFAREAAILSTCNRSEVYVAGEKPGELAAWLTQYHRLAPGELRVRDRLA
jgi:hypothetical protein